MTTIAVSKTTMACDQQATHVSGLKLKVESKVQKVINPLVYPKPFYIGYSGLLEDCHSIIEWFNSPNDRPPKVKNSEYVILTEDKKIYVFSTPTRWIEIKEPFYAIGSGGQYALGALYAGKTPKEAVAISSKLDVSTGMGIKEFSF